ncbi:IclR family transcriptional regulator [Micromonospora auratinigra]|uniref:IclR family transcriptional regulator n=1 Tax=Micromonospora auratinigra TaxID=261654 RepID=UPI000B887FF7|nr:IclR family transcriptional regulator [Micromonospora auratinigra]
MLTILSIFESDSGAHTLGDIAEHAGIPLSTAHRLASELVNWGALERNAQGRYVVGLRLWGLAQNAGRQFRDAARPLLQDLFLLTQETAQVAVRDGDQALYLDRVYSSRRVPRASRVGGRLPLHATAVGKVLLAHEEDRFREAYLDGPLESLTTRTRIDSRWLARELAEARTRGYATTVDEARTGACSIAVPVRTDTGTAALGLVMDSTRAAHMVRRLPTLQMVARRIEAAAARPRHAVPRPRRERG